MKAVIKVASGSTVNIDIELAMKVLDVKNLIAAQTDTPAERQVRMLPNRLDYFLPTPAPSKIATWLARCVS